MKLENEMRYEELIQCAQETGHADEIHERIEDWYEQNLDNDEILLNGSDIDKMMLEELESICLEYGHAV